MPPECESARFCYRDSDHGDARVPALPPRQSRGERQLGKKRVMQAARDELALGETLMGLKTELAP